MRNLLRSKMGNHKIEFYTMPWGKHKGRTFVYCGQCGNEGHTSARWGDCGSVDHPTRPRRSRILQAQQWLDPRSPTAAPPELHGTIREHIALLQKVGAMAQ